MYNGRLNLSAHVLSEIKKYYADKLFKVPISRTVRISEAPSYGQPVMYYDKNSRGAHAYNDLAEEFIDGFYGIKIKVKYINENGATIIKQFDGYQAQIIQHEVDHCAGVLI